MADQKENETSAAEIGQYLELGAKRLYEAILQTIVWVTGSGNHRHSPQTARAHRRGCR
jgi:hypothetical protein